MTTRDRWLDEGLAVLAEDGAPGVRIDRIAARLGLSKGSFHHHFAGAAGFRTALLERYEARAVATLGALVTGTDEQPVTTLSRLPDLVRDLADPRLEVAVRAWAFQDVEARMTQERVDSARLAALEGLWSAIVGEPGRARTAALLPYLVAIGASVALPPVHPDTLDEVFRMLAELVPAVVGAAGGAGGVGADD